MDDETKKRIHEVEEKIEKTNDTISTFVGAGICITAVMTGGGSILAVVIAGGTGAVVGSGVYHAIKWMKNRKRKKENE